MTAAFPFLVQHREHDEEVGYVGQFSAWRSARRCARAKVWIAVNRFVAENRAHRAS
jgi:hypothetical protein